MRPDHVEVSYVVTNPKTGEIVSAKAHRFQNEHTQVTDPTNRDQTGDFHRVRTKDMGWVH